MENFEGIESAMKHAEAQAPVDIKGIQGDTHGMVEDLAIKLDQI